MCSDSPSPDPRVGEAALKNSATAQEALDWYKQAYEENKPRQAKLDAATDQVTAANLESLRDNNMRADEQWQRFKEKAIPTEDRMYSDAMNYDSPTRIASEAAKAGTDAQAGIAMQREANARAMARSGVNPASGRAMAGNDAMAVAGGLGTAAAENAARTRVQDMGIMLRKDAANFGRGMTSTAAQTYGVGTQSGNSALAGIVGSIGANNQSVQTGGQGFNTAIAGYNGAASALNGSANAAANAASSSNANSTALVGTAATVGIAI